VRLSALALLTLAVLIGTTMPAVGKPGMSATLVTRLPLDAKPGTTLRVGWKVANEAAQATTRRDDDRFYVRLLSATGGRSTHAYGTLSHRRYVALVRVPRGGIGGIEIRLKGWQITPSGTRRADALIPITNSPLPA
jgi:hypothetical protein